MRTGVSAQHSGRDSQVVSVDWCPDTTFHMAHAIVCWPLISTGVPFDLDRCVPQSLRVPAEFRDNPLERFEMEARLSKAYDAWMVEELYYHPVFDLPKRWYYQVKKKCQPHVDAYICTSLPRAERIILLSRCCDQSQLFVADPVDHTAGQVSAINSTRRITGSARYHAPIYSFETSVMRALKCDLTLPCVAGALSFLVAPPANRPDHHALPARHLCDMCGIRAARYH